MTSNPRGVPVIVVELEGDEKLGSRLINGAYDGICVARRDSLHDLIHDGLSLIWSEEVHDKLFTPDDRSCTSRSSDITSEGLDEPVKVGEQPAVGRELDYEILQDLLDRILGAVEILLDCSTRSIESIIAEFEVGIGQPVGIMSGYEGPTNVTHVGEKTGRTRRRPIDTHDLLNEGTSRGGN